MLEVYLLKNKIHNLLLGIVSHPIFDGLVVLLIIVNSIFLSLSDYDHVTNSNDLSENGSSVNSLIIQSEVVFTLIFTVEFALKAMAFGLFTNTLVNKEPYFRDSWNWLDFVVVVFALLANTAILPSQITKVFRLFRVLRPLKSVKSFPAVAAIVTGMLNSLADLGETLFTVSVVLVFFSVVGMQLFCGPYLHTRCRITPFPVNTSWVSTLSDSYLNGSTSYPYILSYADYRCLNAPNFDYAHEYPLWKQTDSPWFTPQPDCYWPYDPNSDQQVCSLTKEGTNQCRNGGSLGLQSWCGSNYDALGNPRFNAKTASLDTYNMNLGFGYVNFDSFAYSLLFVIQVFSGDSWSVMMYELTNAINLSQGVLFCSLIVLLGTFFLLQLNVALLQKSFLKQNTGKIERKSFSSLAIGLMNNSVAPLSKNRADKIDGDEDQKVYPHTSLLRKVDFQGTIVYLCDSIKHYDQPEGIYLRRLCKKMYTHPIFERFSLAVVFVNTAMLAYTHYEMDPNVYTILYAAQFVITMYSLFELVLGLVGLGLIDFFSSTYATLDLIIVVLSALASFRSPIPCVFTHGNTCSSTQSSLTSVLSLRSFRCFTIFRLLRMNFFKVVLRRIGKVVNSMQNFLVVLFLFVFIFALIGMQFFANRFHFDSDGFAITSFNSPDWLYAPDKPRSNFDNFTLAFLTIFQIITIDNWSTVMYNCGRAVGPWGIMLPIICLLLGTFFVTNLFLAILVNSFLDADDSDAISDGGGGDISAITLASKREEGNEVSKQIETSVGGGLEDQRVGEMESIEECRDSSGGGEMGKSDEFDKRWNEPDVSMKSGIGNEELRNTMDENVHGSKRKLSQETEVRSHAPDLSGQEEAQVSSSNDEIRAPALEPTARHHAADIEDGYVAIKSSEDLQHRMLNLFSTILNHHAFELTITALVCVSCVSLALDNPLNDPDSILSSKLYYIDLVVTITFAAEMLIKVIVFGAFRKRSDKSEAYFQNGWNKLDFVVVLVSILSIGAATSGAKTIGKFRALRSLRPLKVVQHIPGLRIMCQSLVLAMPTVAEVSVIILLVYFVFGIFFTNFLYGQLRACSLSFDITSEQYASQNNLLSYPIPWDQYSATQRSWFAPSNNYTLGNVTCLDWPSRPCCSSFHSRAEFKLTSRFLCECWGGSWDSLTDFRFDNLAMSMLTLFVSATIDNWTDNMHTVSDNNGIDMQPIRDNHIWWYYVYLIFILIGNFVCIQLFVGVIVKSFEDCNDRFTGASAYVTEEQLEWVKTKRVLQMILPERKFKKSSNLVRAMCFSIFEHPAFKVLANCCIVAQIVVLSLVSFGESSDLADKIEMANFVLALLFISEVPLKWAAYGVLTYMSDRWSRFECVIFIISLLDLVGVVGNIGEFIRLFRVVFVMRGVPILKRFLDFMLLTIPAVGNITVLVVFCIYIFTIIGVDLFAKVAYNGSYSSDSNFRTFGSGFVTLFRMTTDDNWGQYMYDISKNTAHCVVDPPYNSSFCGFSSDASKCLPLNGCGSKLSFPFWILYIVLMTMILLSVFISAIINSYSELTDGSIGPKEFKAFAALWSDFDPDASCFIPSGRLEEFVGRLFVPFGFGGQVYSHKQYMRRVGRIKLSRKDGTYLVHFQDVITALSVAHFERKVKWNKDIIFDTQQGNERRNFLFVRRAQVDIARGPHDLTYFTMRDLLAAQAIQKHWKDSRNRRPDPILRSGEHFIENDKKDGTDSGKCMDGPELSDEEENMAFIELGRAGSSQDEIRINFDANGSEGEDAYMEVNGGDECLQIDGDMDLNEHMHDTGAKAVVIEPDGTYSTMV